MKNKMRNKIGLLVSVFILFALWTGWAVTTTGNSQNEAPIQITSSISAVVKNFSRVIPPPKATGKKAIAAKIDISFPELSCQVGENVAVTTINEAIQRRLLNMLDGKTHTTVEQLMETFGNDYEKSMKKTPKMPGAWFLKFKATVHHYDEDLFCIKILHSVFTGGAHPTSNITYLVFSMKTGNLYSLFDLIPRANLGNLTKAAENHFRQIRNMKPQETYKQAGYRFENDQFSLNRNFLISKSGMSFCFNQCEIAPYAKGITEVLIPWSDLKTVVDAKGPAGRFLKE
ncbi:MAG: DUF3298 and DUF4163 domain-containing protein [Candidatus Riflebacteria bacterium]|nr:DUF3298 and DUF4163 domain-containing protein [Candidatus Riflebacteria bacterium]